MARKGALPKVCASVAAETIDGMVERAERALSLQSDLVEFRVDALRGKNPPAEIARRLTRFARVAVITVRRKGEGGRFEGGEEERLGLISLLARMGPAYLDVELATAKENRGWLASLPKKVERIISWHDFSGTPPIEALRRTRDSELEDGSVAKLVTTARKVEDNLVTLRLCKERPGRVVSFCMGELGSASRLASIEVGAPIVYAALPSEAVAPGQLSVEAMIEFRALVSRR